LILQNGVSPQMNADESCQAGNAAIHPIVGQANTGSALNIRVYLRSSAFICG